MQRLITFNWKSKVIKRFPVFLKKIWQKNVKIKIKDIIWILFKNFIIQYKPQDKPQQSFYFDQLEENDIPHFARHWIDHNDIYEYSNILSEFQKKN